MSKQLYQVTCDKTCGFMIRSTLTKEIVLIMKHHFKTVHQTAITDEDIKERMRKSRNRSHG